MRAMLILAILVATSLTGCRSLKPDYTLFSDRGEIDTDALWRQGYGYNNPNRERIKSGQDAVNFDGQPNDLKSASKDMAGEAVGNALAFGVFEVIPAIWRGIGKKLRR